MRLWLLALTLCVAPGTLCEFCASSLASSRSNTPAYYSGAFAPSTMLSPSRYESESRMQHGATRLRARPAGLAEGFSPISYSRRAYIPSTLPLATRESQRAGRHLATVRKQSLDGSTAEVPDDDMSKFNVEIYSELRDKFAVAQEAPTIISKHGGSEIFTYMPPSFREREEKQRLLPCPDLTPQEVISTILQAMKANRKFGCSIYLRFMSDSHEYSRLTPADLELQLLMGGQTQVLLGNFREFSFPTPTFEMNSQGDSPTAIQEVRLLVPGFLAAMMGASRGWSAEARLRWTLVQDSCTKAWLTDSVEIIPCADEFMSS